MPLTLIEQNPSFTKKVQGEDKLMISEMFCDTLQGEGASVGTIATFMRLQGCTLKCFWCDTLTVWPNGNEYTFEEIFQMWENVDLIDKLQQGQHLVLTGGSPLKQQQQLIHFIGQFNKRYGFKPYIEVENEVVLQPDPYLISLVDQWNNSPKLSNSGMKKLIRHKPQLLQQMSRLNNTWFKFVIDCQEDWQEIIDDFLPYISKQQIILMPQGQTQEELNITRPIVAELAIKHGVRFTDRLHVTIWNKQTGV